MRRNLLRVVALLMMGALLAVAAFGMWAGRPSDDASAATKSNSTQKAKAKCKKPKVWKTTTKTVKHKGHKMKVKVKVCVKPKKVSDSKPSPTTPGTTQPAHPGHDATPAPGAPSPNLPGADPTNPTSPESPTQPVSPSDPQSPSEPVPTPEPTAPPVATIGRMSVTLREFRLVLSRTELPSGPSTIDVVNGGEDPHDFRVLDANGNNMGGSPELMPGEKFRISVNLPKGTYTVLCTMPGHAMAGMKATLKVT